MSHKMTRNQVRHHLNRIIERNFGKVEVVTNQEMRAVYQDLATLAKCIRLIEKQGPSPGADCEEE